jgi:hypothetical protein
MTQASSRWWSGRGPAEPEGRTPKLDAETEPLGIEDAETVPLEESVYDRNVPMKIGTDGTLKLSTLL